MRGLAGLVIALLAIVVTAIVARLGIQVLGLQAVRWRQWSGQYAINQLTKVSDFTIFCASILFVVWFYRARVNAEYRGWRQRRARGWTFWGWVVPIVSLWFPFQLMGDIWRAGLPASRRDKTAWLPAFWWTTWLLLGGITVGSSAGSTVSPWPHLSAHAWTGSLVLLAAGGIALIAIIRSVSGGPVGSPLPGNHERG